MKLAFFFCLTALLNVSAASLAQKISLQKNNVPLKEVLNDIRKQSGYGILCDAELLNESRPVTINITDASLNQALEECLRDQPFSYSINQKTILITGKNAKIADLAVPIAISGIISDEKGLPIPGVTVKVKGTSIAVSSDIRGAYQIKVPDENAVLVFSFIGYSPQEMAVGNNRTINVKLELVNSKLNEVVVIGYGSVRKADLTGAVSSVKVDDMQKAPVGSFEDALAGRVAGLQVSSPSGQPGVRNNIVIRGNNSVTQDNSPLYVIDGFPIENPDNSVLNPADIESINVLKDASSTAVYGARGANGVIVITTKKGKSGAPVITYDGSYGAQKNIKQMKMMDAYNFVKLQLDLSTSNAAMIQYTPGDPSLIGNIAYVPGGRTLDYYKTAPTVNWQNLLYQTGPIQNHDVSVRGGNDQTKYSVSGNYFSQDGTIINSGFNRYQGRVTLDQKVNEKILLNLNANYTSSNTFGITPSANLGSATSALLFAALGYRPITDNGIDLTSLAEDPTLNSLTSDYRYNPVLQARNSVNTKETNTLIANGALNYKITNDLVIKISGGVNLQKIQTIKFYNSHTAQGDTTNRLGGNGVNGSIVNSTINNYVNENTMTWTKAIDRNNKLSLLGGFTLQSVSVSNYGASANHLPNESLGINGLDEGTPLAITANASNNFLESYLVRVNYSFKDKYLLTGSYRADGSSKFAPGNRWGYFPSGAFAWRITSEPFMKRINFISNAKLRTSYGVTGNNRVTDFAYLSTVTFPVAANYTFNNVYNIGNVSSLGNSQLKWESTAQKDVGLDISFFKDKLSLTVDYYDKVTSNLLLNAQLPPSSGYLNGFKNVGTVSNHGWEFELNTQNIVGSKFSWNSSFNISFNRNKVLALTENQLSLLTNVPWETSYVNAYPYIARIGQPIAMIYGYKWDGVYQYADFNKLPNGTYVLKGTVPDNGSGRNVVQPGDIKYADLNGDGTVNAQDRTIIGNPNPNFIGGLSNDFTYKGFDLSVFMQWSYGNDVLNANKIYFEGNGNSINQFATYEDRWTPTNPSNTYFRARGYGPSGVYSSRVVEDGSFIRLKTVSLGYNFPPKLLKRAKIKTARLYASAQNILTITGYSGYDPEVSTQGSTLTPGFDFSAYPRPLTVVIGGNFSF